MINLEVGAAELLREVTILAAERRSLADKFHQLPLHTRSRSSVRSPKRKKRLGFHELDKSADMIKASRRYLLSQTPSSTGNERRASCNLSGLFDRLRE